MEDVAKEITDMKETIALLRQELQSQAMLIKSQSETITSMQNKPRRGLIYKPDPPPHFFGDKRGPSAREWLFQTQLYLGLMEDVKYSVQFATTYLRGAAATWWFNKLRAANAEETLAWSDWDTFAEMLKKEFEPVNPVRVARRRLDEIRQRYSVQQYVKEFRDITQQIPGITNEELLHRFITGLKETVRRDVDKAEPNDLEGAIRLAEKVDYYEMKSKSRNDALRVERIGGATPMELGSIKEKQDNKEALKRKGACYTCRKIGHRAKDCRGTKQGQGNGRL